MANVQSVFGFRHIGFLSGYAPDYQQQTRLVQSTNTTKIFNGDPVVKSGATNYIVQGSSTTILEGIFVGCTYQATGGSTTWSPYWVGAAAADAIGYLINAPGALFLAAALNTAIVTANIGANIGYSIGTGSTVGGGFSGATLDQSTISTTNTLPFQIVSLYQGIGNGSDPLTAYNWAVVTFNNQRFRTLTGVA
jgi:hypothetical protein